MSLVASMKLKLAEQSLNNPVVDQQYPIKPVVAAKPPKPQITPRPFNKITTSIREKQNSEIDKFSNSLSKKLNNNPIVPDRETKKRPDVVKTSEANSRDTYTLMEMPDGCVSSTNFLKVSDSQADYVVADFDKPTVIKKTSPSFLRTQDIQSRSSGDTIIPSPRCSTEIGNTPPQLPPRTKTSTTPSNSATSTPAHSNESLTNKQRRGFRKLPNSNLNVNLSGSDGSLGPSAESLPPDLPPKTKTEDTYLILHPSSAIKTESPRTTYCEIDIPKEEKSFRIKQNNDNPCKIKKSQSARRSPTTKDSVAFPAQRRMTQPCTEFDSLYEVVNIPAAKSNSGTNAFSFTPCDANHYEEGGVANGATSKSRHRPLPKPPSDPDIPPEAPPLPSQSKKEKMKEKKEKTNKKKDKKDVIDFTEQDQPPSLAPKKLPKEYKKFDNSKKKEKTSAIVASITESDYDIPDIPIPKEPAVAIAVEDQDWFFDGGREAVSKFLKKKGHEGGFVVRPGSQTPYVLSVLCDGQIIKNLKIRKKKENVWAIGEMKENEIEFSNVLELIQHQMENGLSVTGINHHIKILPMIQ